MPSEDKREGTKERAGAEKMIAVERTGTVTYSCP